MYIQLYLESWIYLVGFWHVIPGLLKSNLRVLSTLFRQIKAYL